MAFAPAATGIKSGGMSHQVGTGRFFVLDVDHLRLSKMTACLSQIYMKICQLSSLLLQCLDGIGNVPVSAPNQLGT